MIDLGADLEGEAREVAADHAKLALQARAAGKRTAIFSGGELTVTVRGNGRGGPNQEYALALADLLKDTADVSALAGDTDGADGGGGKRERPRRRADRRHDLRQDEDASGSSRRPISTTTMRRRSSRRPAICCCRVRR